MARPQVSIAFTEKTSAWFSKLSPQRRALVEARLRELALDPESAPFREFGPGVTRYIARIDVDDDEVWGFRVDYIIDEQMKAHLPAIVGVGATPLPYQHR